MAQTITQILLLIISGIAVFTIIVPTFNTIGETQQETDEYSLAIESAFTTNERLNALLRQADDFSQQERYRLYRLVPATIDPIRTAYDLEVLVEKNNLFLINLNVLEEFALPDPVITSSPASSEEFVADSTNVGNIGYRDFELVTAGTYDQFKTLLADIEASAQLFEVQSVTFQSTDSDITQFSLVMRTFGLHPNLTAVTN